MAVENGVEITHDGTDQLLIAIKELAGTSVMIGIPESSTRSDADVTNATLGYINEFGSPAKNIPARPFLIPGVSSITEKATAILANAASLQMDGKPRQGMAALEAVGQLGVNAVKNQIVTGSFVPLAPRTIAARKTKGRSSTKPLIDTGQLLNAITWVLRKK